MDTDINYTLVGVFVVSLLTAIVFATIWLSSGLSFIQYTTYAVYMKESVSGLNIDSPVEFNGVDVGTVSNIQLDPRNPKRVTVLLRIKHSAPVTRGTVATLNTRGITGITFLALKDRNADLRPIPILKGELYPIIKAGPSLFLRIDLALQQLTSDLHGVTQSIQSVLDKENQLAIKKTLLNLQQISSSLANSDDQVLPAVYRALQHFDETSRNLEYLTTQVRQNPSILVRGVAAPLPGPGESS